MPSFETAAVRSDLAETDKLRELPSVDEALGRLSALQAEFPRHLIAAEIRRIRHTLTRREQRFGEDRLRENAARALAALALKRAYAINSTRQIEFARALLEDALDWLPDA